MRKWFKIKIGKEDRGVAAIEFAILLPVLLLTFFGLFDIANFSYCSNKMNRTAQEINNIVTRGNLTKPELDSLLQVSVLIAQPFNFTASGNVIVTSVAVVSANQGPQIMWQDSYPGGTSESRIAPASLPGGLVLNTNQTAIFTEVFFTYTPLISNYILAPSQTQIYALAAALPRQGQMTTLPAS
ncbi:MAG: pilus assembly protein [Alphaproteobacteria bacterium]|nr:pilus assembly protein [Alphaproteobacteria bacterium]